MVKNPPARKGDTGLISGPERSPEEGIGYPLQYSWAYFPGGPDGKESPAMQETWVRSLGLEDPLVEGMATHSSILAWRIPGRKELDTTEYFSLSLSESTKRITFLVLHIRKPMF